MINLSNGAILNIKNGKIDDIEYQYGYIVYSDGYIFDIGRVIGNFLYDKKYVYKWSINRAIPYIYDIENRCEIVSMDERRDLTNKMMKLLKK